MGGRRTEPGAPDSAILRRPGRPAGRGFRWPLPRRRTVSTPIIIYNLFPRLVGHMRRWAAHAGRAREMGFNWLFLNPVQYPGFSGSLYAVKDHYRINPLFVPPGVDDGMAELRRTVDTLHSQGLRVMMDLVINHTAKDCELTESHPEWYRRDEDGEVLSPSAIDPADSRKVTVWGDLAEIDNRGTPDRAGLWSYWTELLTHYLELGFDGFRCDAAYKVPAELWDRLIGTARRARPADPGRCGGTDPLPPDAARTRHQRHQVRRTVGGDGPARGRLGGRPGSSRPPRHMADMDGDGRSRGGGPLPLRLRHRTDPADGGIARRRMPFRLRSGRPGGPALAAGGPDFRRPSEAVDVAALARRSALRTLMVSILSSAL